MGQTFTMKWIIIVIIIIIILLIIFIYVYWISIPYNFINDEIVWEPENDNYYPHSLYIPLDREKSAITEYSPYSSRESRNKNFIAPKDSFHVWHFTDFGRVCQRVRDRTTILFFCHEKVNISHCKWLVDLCHKEKVNLFLVDYPKCKSLGEMMDTFHKCGERAFEYLSIIVGEGNIVLWGHSLGGNIATKLARKYECKGLILSSPFLNFTEFCTQESGIIGWLIGFLYDWSPDNQYCLSNIDFPVVISDYIHRPSNSAKILYKSCSSKKKLFIETQEKGEIHTTGEDIKKIMELFN